jgi:tetratricopeptide (TPR) repeat protein
LRRLNENEILKAMKSYFKTIILVLFSIVQVTSQSLEQGITSLTNENYSAARKIFANIIASNPKSGEAYFYMGESYYELEKLDSARHFYQLGIAANNRAGLNYVGLGKLDWNDNKKKEARDNFERAERLGKGKEWRIPFEIGKAYLYSEDRKLDIAIEKLEEAKDLSRTNPEVWSVLGDAYRDSNQGGKAASAYSYVIEQLKIESPEIYRKRGELFKRSKTYDLAIENFERAIQLDPSYAPAYRDLIDVYQNNLNKYEKVTPLLKKYTDLVGDDLEARTRYIGFLFRQAKDYENVVLEADRLLAQDPAIYQAHRWKGYALVELGRAEEGLETMNTFFAKVGENRTYFSDYDYFARAAADMKEFDKAAEKLRFALSMEIAKDEIYDRIAKMYYESRMYKEAAEAYKVKMANVEPVSTDYFYLGYSLYMIRDYEAADKNFAVVTELLPDYIAGFVLRAKSNEFLDPDLELFKAKPFHEKVIELAADDYKRYGTDLINAHRYLAFESLKRDDNESAKLHFEKITVIGYLDSKKFVKNLIEAHNSLGYIYLQGKSRDDKVKAKENYEKVVQLDPANQDALTALDYIKKM